MFCQGENRDESYLNKNCFEVLVSEMICFYFRTCNIDPCPEWTDWSQWSDCSVTCGGGKRNRDRACQLPNGQERPESECPGEPDEREDCNTDRCPGMIKTML